MCVFQWEVLAKTPGRYQVPNRSYGQKTQKGGKGGKWEEGGGGGKRSWGREKMREFLGEVLAKTSGLYLVTNWSYGQKTQKREGGGK